MNANIVVVYFSQTPKTLKPVDFNRLEQLSENLGMKMLKQRQHGTLSVETCRTQ